MKRKRTKGPGNATRIAWALSLSSVHVAVGHVELVVVVVLVDRRVKGGGCHVKGGGHGCFRLTSSLSCLCCHMQCALGQPTRPNP
jgi:hypothetical protein